MAAPINNRFDKRALIRVTSWGTAAAAALAAAGLSTLSPVGSQQIAGATGARPQAALVQQAGEVDAETRRLNEAVRLLAADRDRLMNRIASLERNVDDMTGSIKRQAEQPALPKVPVAAPDTTASLPLIPPAPQPEPPQSEPPQPAPAAAAETTAPNQTIEWLADPFAPWTKTTITLEAASTPEAQSGAFPPIDGSPQATGETATPLGVDIGGGVNLEQVRALWRTASAKHAPLFAGLHPIIALRESRPGVLDIRLLVGPLADAGQAARLCGYLIAAKIKCSTHPFDGQRLAER